MHHANHRMNPSKFCLSSQSRSHFRSGSFLSKLLLMMVLVFSSAVSHAQGFSDVLADRVTPDWDDLMPSNYGLSPHDFSLMGDNIDLHTGQLSFSQVDVSLPGNSDLEVAIRRELNPSQYRKGEFHNWHLALPSIQTKVPDVAGAWSGQRCSKEFKYTLPKAYFPGLTNDENRRPGKWSEGVKLVIPGEASQEVLDKPVGSLFPSSAKKVTPNGWYFTCISSVVTSTGESENQGEGFYGYAPDGRRYKFNRYVVRESVSASETWSVATVSGGLPNTTTSSSTSSSDENRYQNHYYIIRATEVTDQNGNWVKYSYDSHGRVTAIYSNDGRRIELEYTAPDHVLFPNGVLRIVANPGTSQERAWAYHYEGTPVLFYNDGRTPIYVSSQGQTFELRRVTLPDGRTWEYQLAGLQAQAVQGGGSPGSNHCRQADQGVSVKHPDGAYAEYRITEVPFYTGRFQHPLLGEGPVCPNTSSGNGVEISYNMAVNEKRLLGFATWKYEYNTDRGPKTGQIWPTNKTQVINPDGSMTHYYHTVPTLTKGGTMEREELYESEHDSTPVQTIEYEYNPASRFGTSVIDRDYANTSQYRTLRTKMTLTRGSDEYTTEYSYNQSLTPSHSFGQPTSIKRYSNVSSGTREEIMTYHHDRGDWVMGQLQSLFRNGKRFADYGYDSKGRIAQYAAFGVQQGTYTYNGDGTLKIYKDALNRRTFFENWYRGTPRKITEAYGTADQRITEIGVDANGWVTSSKNPRGYTTYYEHDEAGRYTKIDLPAPNNDIHIAYSGIGNNMTQIITQGNRREETRYDSMLRPRYVRTSALDTSRYYYTTTGYDSSGRVVYTTPPSAGGSQSQAIETKYDVFDRVIEIREKVAPRATTTMEYLSGNRTRTTDPEGYVTTTTYSGYGSPDDGQVVRIDQPEGVSTVINRDIYGLMNSVTQAGMTQNYYYNDELLLCRYRTPEGGDTLYAYDAARDMSSYAKGQSYGTSCSTPSGTAKVSLVRDSLGRVKLTNYAHSGTSDISVTYDDNDNVKTTNRGGVNWSYSYDNMDRLLTEKLDIDGRNYDMSYTYDGNGYMTKQVLPSNRAINYVRSGLGDALTVWTPHLPNFVDDIWYHPDSTVRKMRYGNGQEYMSTLNKRLLPERILSQKGSTTAIDLTYTYDARGDITDMVDGTNSSNTRNYRYDGLGRLTYATGPWAVGYYSSPAIYSYDDVGNLTEKSRGPLEVTNTYDSRNRLMSTRSANFGQGTTRAVSYDSRGNITTLGDQNFVYDYADQPISISGSANGSYQYDGNLKRVKSTVNGKTIYNVYNLAGQLMYVDEATENKKTEYIRAAGMNIARIQNNVVTYLHQDHLGSASAGTTSSGSIAWRERYTPYGEKLVDYEANDDQASFTGHIYDSETGLTYMQARYYDPTIGRFLSIDPVGFAEHMDLGNGTFGFNRYAYANNSPTKYIDPDGAYPQSPASSVENGRVINSATTGQKAATLGVMAGGILVGRAVVACAASAPCAAAATVTLSTQVRKAKPKTGSTGGQGAGKGFSEKVKEQARQESNNTCVFCGKKTTKEPGPNKSEIDHAVPKSRDGNNTSENAQNTCRTCNRKKGTKTTEEFMEINE